MRSAQATHPGPKTSVLLYWVGRAWMWAFGWDVEGEPPNTPKGILVAAPHTSNWDLPHMLAASFVFRLRIQWLGKHTLFAGPAGPFMRFLGGLPVDRRAAHGAVKAVASLFGSHDQLVISVPPSGTRSRREHWKSGFYWMAHTAQVPIILGYLDYSRKRAGLGAMITPTGDVHADMEKIRAFYADKRGKFPDSETPVRLEEEDRTHAAEGAQ